MPTTDTFGSLEKSPDAFGVSCIYAQVVGCLMFMMLFQQCPGPRGLLLAIGALGTMMAKHIFVDGLVPPPPAMLFAGVTFCAAAVSGIGFSLASLASGHIYATQGGAAYLPMAVMGGLGGVIAFQLRRR